MISTAQKAVAAAMSVSPVPQPTPVGAWMRSWLASSTPMAPTCSRPRRSPRNTTARIATHTKSVLWITAAAGAVASARPVKKRTKGMLPPSTPSATSPGTARARGTHGPRTTASAIVTRSAAATAFFRVVNSTGSSKARTADALTKTETPLTSAVAPARASPVRTRDARSGSSFDGSERFMVPPAALMVRIRCARPARHRRSPGRVRDPGAGQSFPRRRAPSRPAEPRGPGGSTLDDGFRRHRSLPRRHRP